MGSFSNKPYVCATVALRNVTGQKGNPVEILLFRLTARQTVARRAERSICLFLLGLGDFVLKHINQGRKAVPLKDGAVFHPF